MANFRKYFTFLGGCGLSGLCSLTGWICTVCLSINNRCSPYHSCILGEGKHLLVNYWICWYPTILSRAYGRQTGYMNKGASVSSRNKSVTIYVNNYVRIKFCGFARCLWVDSFFASIAAQTFMFPPRSIRFMSFYLYVIRPPTAINQLGDAISTANTQCSRYDNVILYPTVPLTTESIATSTFRYW